MLLLLILKHQLFFNEGLLLLQCIAVAKKKKECVEILERFHPKRIDFVILATFEI